MKTFMFSLIAFFAVVSITMGGNYKKYPHKSGKIVYELSGNTKGERILYWDDYGWKEMTVEKSITKIFGIKQETNTYTLVLGDEIYTWNDNDDKITKTSNDFVESWEESGYDEDDLAEFGYEIMESLGYSKVGNETVQGKSCEVWEGSLGKIWVWESYHYKSEVKMMGMKMNTIAKEVDFDFGVAQSLFEYPKDRKIQNVN